ncbi:MAG: hypothetical protein ACKVOJ_09935, partial [Sphingomonadaceae bacterium]
KADVAIRPCVATILQKGRRRANIPQRKSLPLPTPTSLGAQLRLFSVHAHTVLVRTKRAKE